MQHFAIITESFVLFEVFLQTYPACLVQLWFIAILLNKRQTANLYLGQGLPTISQSDVTKNHLKFMGHMNIIPIPTSHMKISQ